MNVEQRKVLLDLYNQVWSSEYVPKQLKQAILIPLIKLGKPANKITSYRPIALTNCLCKIYEKIITQTNIPLGYKEHSDTSEWIQKRALYV